MNLSTLSILNRVRKRDRNICVFERQISGLTLGLSCHSGFCKGDLVAGAPVEKGLLKPGQLHSNHPGVAKCQGYGGYIHVKKWQIRVK